MPKVADFKESKFLKQTDIPEMGMLVTIGACTQQNVAMEGAPPDPKWCLHYEELDKPHVINLTNAQSCGEICGSDDTDDWIGHKVVLYVDPNVMYSGKRVGGIRIRKPKQAAAKTTKPKPVELEDVPFMWLMPFVLPALGLVGLMAS